MAAVLHVTDTLLGGLGQVVVDLVHAQADAGWRVSVAAPQDPRTTDPVRRSGGTSVQWSPGARPGPGFPRDVRRLGRAVRATRPDLVHLHGPMAGLCGRLVVRGRVPTLFQPHSWSFFAAEGLLRAAALAWERRGARWAQQVLCVSEDEREHARREGLRIRSTVIANGVDLTRFAAAGATERAAAREALALGAGPLVVCPGRLHRQKGQLRLLDAWPRVLDAVPDAELILVGEGPDRAALLERRLPGVRLVGQVPDVPRWLAAADVVALPSTWEGMSLALLEARATARAVVVTDVPGMREVVLPGTGAVVPLGEAGALADALAERLRDPDLADREGRAARADVEKRHDLTVQRQQVLELSLALVRGRRG